MKKIFAAIFFVLIVAWFVGALAWDAVASEKSVSNDSDFEFPIRFSIADMVLIVDERDDGYSIAVHRGGELISFSE